VADRYRIITRLGQGGMGAVYKAGDTRLGGIHCALKEMSLSAIIDPVEKKLAQQAFQREAQLLSTLSHPNLPRVTDYFSHGEKQFLVMDMIEGQTLESYLENQTQPISEDQVVEWGCQLCDVLHYLHTRKPPIIFRDIKPGNIMISAEDGSIKLIDFGIARFFKPESQKDTVALGTPGYAPPEQYGKQQSDPRSDVYALGATLHQLLTLRDPGIQPFIFPKPRSINPRLSPVLENIIMRAVMQNPDHRWQSTEEILQELERISADHKPVPVQAPSSVYSPGFFPQSPAIRSAQPIVPAVDPDMHAWSKASQTMVKADLAPRFAAYLLDMIFLNIILIPIMLILVYFSMDDEMIILSGLIYILITICYFALCHASWGKTPGKKIASLKLVKIDGSAVSFWRAFWRALLFPVTAVLLIYLVIGLAFFIWPLFHNQNRGLHDLLSGTLVIKV
jgi:serine/threonine protein kinase